MAKEVFTRKTSLLMTKLHILRNIFVMCFVWSTAFLGKTWTLRKIGMEVFGELQNLVMEKINWLEKVTNEEVLEHIGEKRTLVNNIFHR